MIKKKVTISQFWDQSHGDDFKEIETTVEVVAEGVASGTTYYIAVTKDGDVVRFLPSRIISIPKGADYNISYL